MDKSKLTELIRREIAKDPEIRRKILAAKEKDIASRFVERLEESFETGLPKKLEERVGAIEKKIKDIDRIITSGKYADKSARDIKGVMTELAKIKEDNVAIEKKIALMEKRVSGIEKIEKKIEKGIKATEEQTDRLTEMGEKIADMEDKLTRINKVDIVSIEKKIAEVKGSVASVNEKITTIDKYRDKIDAMEDKLSGISKIVPTKKEVTLPSPKVEKKYEIAKEFGEMVIEEFGNKIMLILAKTIEEGGLVRGFNILIALEEEIKKDEIDLVPFQLKLEVSKNMKILPRIMEFEEFKKEKKEILEEIKRGEIIFAREDLVDVIKNKGGK